MAFIKHGSVIGILHEPAVSAVMVDRCILWCDRGDDVYPPVIVRLQKMWVTLQVWIIANILNNSCDPCDTMIAVFFQSAVMSAQTVPSPVPN